MPFSKNLIALRKEKNLSQAELASKLYVTRQAISRWENDITTPGIDMLKLISEVLQVPVTRLLDMPEKYCQSCGMYLTDPAQHGHEADGTLSEEYCVWCYDQGRYTQDLSMDELIETCAPFMKESMNASLDEAVSLLGAVLPHLKRWKEADQE